MNYQECIQYLQVCSALGSRPGLDTITELLRRLGNPQEGLRLIHLAGTNGKGSIGCFLQHGLQRAGYKVGFFTSPYLFNHREMIRMDCQVISETDFAEALSQVRVKADGMEREGFCHPTEFEIMTATAYLYFWEKRCEFVVVEAGMGGAKDATNVMRHSEVSVLSRIDYDHTQFLGSTLSEITREKCGIFRPKCSVVVYPEQEKECLLMIEKEAKRREASLVLPLKDAITVQEVNAMGSVFSYGSLNNVRIIMPGAHQILNAVTAMTALLVLREKGITISDEAIYLGFSEARWEGRFEILLDKPPVLLDGAHNVNGALAFSKAVLDCFPDTGFIGVVGMLRDKNFEASLAAFSKVCRKLIVTEVPNPRSASVEELLETANKLGLEALGEKNSIEAVRCAFSERQSGEGIFCAGSLYALSAFRSSCTQLISTVFD